VAVVADLGGKTLRRVDLVCRVAESVAPMQGGMDAQLAPLVGVDHRGERAVFMDAREERCDASLELADLVRGGVRCLLPPLSAPGRVCGAFMPGDESVLAMQQRLGDEPRFRLLRVRLDGTTQRVMEAELAQPLSVPVFVGDRTACFPLSLRSHPMATYGPVDLVAMDVDGGTAIPLTRSGEVRGRCRVEGCHVLVEGGNHVVRVAVS
jgi:hypothetical protein